MTELLPRFRFSKPSATRTKKLIIYILSDSIISSKFGSHSQVSPIKKRLSFNQEHTLECSQHTPLQSETYKKITTPLKLSTLPSPVKLNSKIPASTEISKIKVEVNF